MIEPIAPSELDEIRHELKNDIPRAQRHIHELMVRGHTAHAIRKHLPHLSYSKITDYATHGASLPPLEYPSAREPTFRPRHYDCHESQMFVQVPDEYRQQIIVLQRRVKRLRGTTPLDSPLRRASSKLDALYYELSQRGVRIRDLARAGGVSDRAIRIRITRHEREVNP
jgi:hypothetical protein